MSENVSARDEEVGAYAIERPKPTIVVAHSAKHTPFVHLHNHTEFSLLDGASRINEMVARASELGQTSLALTDHGVMYGAIPFYKACKKAGIKPIIGYEAYVAPRSHKDKDPKLDVNPNHLTLLAASAEGYINLMKLSSIGHLEGMYYKPRIDKEVLAAHSEGVIALSGCLAGEVASRITEGKDEEARTAIGSYKEIFGDRFFLEVQRHGIPEQERVVAALVRYAKEFNMKLVATNDSHYTKKSDAEAHDILLCMQTGSRYYDPKRWRFDSDSFYLSDGDEMSRIFSDVPESLRNTLEVAEMTDLSIELDATKSRLPRVPLPDGMTAEQMLVKDVEAGFARRYPHPTSEHLARLREEMTVITQMGYASYFLIVADFINFAKRSDIPVGPGRGSAAGSIVAYSLGITALDPIEHRLLFERFLNKDRISMPDIDTDFSVAGREKVINYIADRYGREYVAQIVTMGTMASRAAIRDVSRVLEVPLKVADVMAKLVPVERGQGWPLNKVITEVPEIRDAFNGVMKQDKLREIFGEGVNSETIQKVFKTAIQLEGISRNAGKHAAGVVIGDKPLVNYTPLQLDKDKTNTITQYDMGIIEELGLLKMDLLGLQNLDILAGALKIIKLERGLDIDLDTLPANDKLTMEMISAGDTLGTFQLAGDGMRRMLMEMKPENFQDIAAAIALFRPGPMINIPQYVARKHGREAIEYPHPALEGLLKETYGIMIYQEQVMEAARILAGYTLPQADLLRKIMGKKKAEAMAAEKSKFVAGCVKSEHKIPEDQAGRLFDMIAKFADYGFNRSHSAAYAVLSYQTSYLKANYRLEYMAAVLAQAAGDIDKTAAAINDCRTHGIEVKAPDVNSSHATHWVDGPAIRFGFDAIKNLGEKAAAAIVEERNSNGPYTSLYDLASRTLTLESRAVNKNAVQALVVCGACDSFAERARLAASVDAVCELVRKQKAKAAKISKNQMGLDLFAGEDGGKAPKFEPELPAPVDTPPLDPIERLKWERDSLGIYVTGHPVEIIAKDLRRLTDGPLSIVQPESKGKTVRVGGLINSVRKIITKKGDPMAFVEIEDQTGRTELTVFPRTMKEFGHVFVEDTVVLIEGKVDVRERQRPGQAEADEEVAPTASLIVDAAYSWQEANKLTERPKRDVHVDLVGISEEAMDLLLAAAKSHPGGDRLFLLTRANGHDIKIESDLRVSADDPFLLDLREAIGLNVAVESMQAEPSRREANFEMFN